jgi:hypothetical protein
VPAAAVRMPAALLGYSVRTGSPTGGSHAISIFHNFTQNWLNM